MIRIRAVTNICLWIRTAALPTDVQERYFVSFVSLWINESYCINFVGDYILRDVGCDPTRSRIEGWMTAASAADVTSRYNPHSGIRTDEPGRSITRKTNFTPAYNRLPNKQLPKQVIVLQCKDRISSADRWICIDWTKWQWRTTSPIHTSEWPSRGKCNASATRQANVHLEITWKSLGTKLITFLCKRDDGPASGTADHTQALMLTTTT